MVFSGIPFLFYFLPIVLICYYAAPSKMRNLILFLASLVFYAWGEPIYILIMLFSTVFDYCNGLLIERFNNNEVKKRIVLIISVVGNLFILGFFKYADFLIGNINTLLGTEISALSLPLPIGISFYTFQTMSYTIDVYRKTAAVQKNIISFGCYVALFPQLIAGPIIRYNTIADQLNYRKESFDKFSEGLTRFIAGLGKKVLFANNIGALWDLVKSTPTGELSVLCAWLGILAFAFQIYFDFSGYSDMAIGLGKMFGFTFLENFNYPYISKSITEFWRRWHISLGTWFKEYVYIPLGGNRKGKIRMVLNLFAVWFLTGLWHGASWNFVFWGLYYFALLMLEKLLLKRVLEKTPKGICHIYVIVATLLGWVIFEAPSLLWGVDYLSVMTGTAGANLLDGQFLYLLYSFRFVLIMLVIGCTPFPKTAFERITSGRLYILKPIFSIIVFFLCAAYLVDSTYNPFLYFRF